MWRIGRDPSWYPLNLMGKDQYMLGFTNELVGIIAAKKKLRFELISSSSQNLFEELDRGDYDGILGTLQPNYLTKDKYDFSQALYLVGPVLIVNSDKLANSIKAMDGKILGLMSDITPIFDVNSPTTTLKIFRNTLVALDNLRQKQIDGLVMYALPAYSHVLALYPHSLKITTPPLTQEGIRLIFPKSKQGVDHVLAEFNEGLQEVREEGLYQQLLNKWGLIDTAHPDSQISSVKD